MPFPGRLVYKLDGDLWLMDGASPGMPRRLTEGQDVAHSPAWSPDGRWISYVRRQGGIAIGTAEGHWKPVVFGEAGGPQTGVVDQVQWAPDSSLLAFTVRPENAAAPRQLWLAGVGEKGLAGLRQVDVGASQVNAPWNWLEFTFTPDGRFLTLAVVEGQSLWPQVLKVPVSGGEPSVLLMGEEPASTGGLFRAPRWSPDGKRLAYLKAPASASIAADGVQLFVLVQGRPVSLGTMLAHAHWLAWSPDGARLAWVEGSGRSALENKRIAIWSEAAVVRSPGLADFDPVWTPDGKAVAGSFASAPGIPRRIRRIDLTGKVLPDRCPEGNGNPARADYAPFFTADGGMFFVWQVEEFPASLVWTGTNCQQVAVVVRQMDVPDGFYGAMDWSRVMAWTLTQ